MLITLADVIEDVRTYMEQNKAAVGSVHAGSVIATLYKLGYRITVSDIKKEG